MTIALVAMSGTAEEGMKYTRLTCPENQLGHAPKASHEPTSQVCHSVQQANRLLLDGPRTGSHALVPRHLGEAPAICKVQCCLSSADCLHPQQAQ